MKVCIIGSGFTLTLANVLIKKDIKVDIYSISQKLYMIDQEH